MQLVNDIVYIMTPQHPMLYRKRLYYPALKEINNIFIYTK